MAQKSPSKNKLTVATKIRSVDRQQLLFERELLNAGTRRNYAGDFFEEATCLVTGGLRLKTCSNVDICPDVVWGPLVDNGHYFEVKSCGRSAKVGIYERRLHKDREFVVNNGVTLTYWLWRHKLRTNEADTPGDLQAALAREAGEVYVLHFAALDEILSHVELKESKTKGKEGGWGSEGYDLYRNLKMTALADHCIHTYEVPGPLVYNHQLPGLVFRCALPEHVEYLREGSHGLG